MKAKWLREIREDLESIGIEVISFEQTKRHIRVNMRKDGVVKFATASSTPRDHRGRLNFKSDARKLFTQAGQESRKGDINRP